MITIAQLVQREVIYCVSSLISELSNPNQCYWDELSPVLSQDDWESAAIDMGWKRTKKGIWFLTISGDEFEGTAQELCEEWDTEPHQTEAYEHWIVTGWLADKLEAKGEMILRDFLGIRAIWGRACTGQAISLDNVVQEIYNELKA